MIESLEELEAIKQSYRSMVTKSSGLSAGTAIIPIPGVNIGSDVAILLRLIPKINEKFGLSPEQIESLDTETKLFIMTSISTTGSKMAGKYITRKLITVMFKRMAGRISAKSASTYVPFLGSAIAGGISFATMKYMGNSHIDDCYEIILATLENDQLEPVALIASAPEPVPPLTADISSKAE